MDIAIVIVTYNRANSLKRVLHSISRAYYDDKVDLIISIDKSDNNEIENIADSFQWKYGSLKIIKHPTNLGLRKHILSIGEYLNIYDALIVLEDDITVTPSFYYFARSAVEKYNSNSDIAGISLYNFPINYQNLLPFYPIKSEYDVYFMNCAQSWGQVWMRTQWFAFKEWYLSNNEEFNIETLPQIINKWPKSSWLKYHTRYCIEKNKYFVYPYFSFSTNNSDEGSHVKISNNLFHSNLFLGEQKSFLLPDINDCVVKYDGFFQAKFLSNYLGIDSNDLCVDLYLSKPKKLYKKYLLTTASLPYKIVREYEIDYRPLEANILLNNLGNGLFLYDTTILGERKAINKHKLFVNLYKNNIAGVFKFIGIGNIIKIILNYCINRVFKN